MSVAFWLTPMQAQILEKDTIKAYTRYPYIQYTNQRDQLSLTTVDTSIAQFQNQHPVLQGDFYSLYLGNIGQAHHRLVFDYQRPVGFHWGFRQFEKYYYKSDSVKYFRSPYPYTKLYYVLGPEEEQIINVAFAYSIKRQLHYSFDYRRITAPGIYNRQNTGWHNAEVNTWYHSKDDRYNLLTHFVLNDGDIAQNGGVPLGDTLFNDINIFPKSTVGVALSSAETNIRDRNVLLQQTYDWGKRRKKSTETNAKKLDLTPNFIPQFRIGHAFSYQTNAYRYRDANPSASFYNQIRLSEDTSPVDSLLVSRQTNDSLRVRGVTNDVFAILFGQRRLFRQKTNGADSLSNMNRSTNFRAKVGFQHQFYKARRFQQFDTTFVEQDSSIVGLLTPQNQVDRFHSAILYGDIYNSLLSNRLTYQARGQYALLGYNLGDFSVYGKIQLLFSEKLGQVIGEINAQNITPDYIQMYYNGNHDFWNNNNFRKTNSLKLKGTYQNDFFKLKASYVNHTLNNYIVWNENAMPEQLGEVVNISQFIVQKDVQLWKFHLDNTLVYQVSTSNNIRFPAFWSRHQLYFESSLFRNALQSRIGINVSYNTNYNAYAYQPSTSQFYLQNEQELTYYPVIDLFATFKIKRVRLFAKMEHVNQPQGILVARTGYFSAPFYPMPDRNFKFGLSWAFYD